MSVAGHEQLKVLWFVNTLFPEACERLGVGRAHGGSWMIALAGHLAARADIALRIVCVRPEISAPVVFTGRDGVEYAILPETENAGLRWARRHRLTRIALQVLPLSGSDAVLRRCAEQVQSFAPDIVHFHGAEACFGLLAERVEMPCVLSIQGILDSYRPHYWGAMSAAERLRYPDLLLSRWRMEVSARRERRIFRSNRNFIGRTAWDKSRQAILSPSGRYYHLDECLRPEFLRAEWRLQEALPDRILTVTSSEPWKGTDTLVDAAERLASQGHRVQLRIAGPIATTTMGRRLLRRIQQKRIAGKVVLLGQLNAAQIVDEMRQSRVFVLPSHIENSPNSLCEAQAVGIPAVASATGGVPTIGDGGRAARMVPRGDSMAMATAIAAILQDDALAAELSRAARALAHARHDGNLIASRQVEIYRTIVQAAREEQ